MDTAANVTQVALSLALVLGALGALTWVTNRLRGNVASSSSGNIRVLSATSIGPKEKLMLVDVAGEQLLLGVSAAGVNTLHTLSEPVSLESQNASPSGGSIFSKILLQQRESQQ